MIHPDIDIVSVQSEAGYGKSYLALAAALFLVFERKAHEKIYVIKPMIEIGQKLGYLPGKFEEKMEPYIATLLNWSPNCTGCDRPTSSSSTLPPTRPSSTPRPSSSCRWRTSGA